MAFNVVETQKLNDDDHTAIVKVTAVANGAFNVNTIIIQANSLFGANASMPYNRLSVTSVQYSTDAPATGYVQLWWSGNTGSSNSASNTIYSFGVSNDGELNGLVGNPIANSTGDIGITVQGFLQSNTLNFIIAVMKDNFTNPGAGAWANGQSAYLDQSGH